MAAATMADLSSVGITPDHVACTSGPLSFSQHGITFIIAVPRAFCPLNGESDLGCSQRVIRCFPQLIGR
jgi:hypothetical protein